MDHEPDGDWQTAAAAPGPARDGQVALITGGSAGLGLAIAGALARAGTDIILASRSARRCEQAAAGLAGQTGRTVTGHACDVTDEHAVAALVDRVMADHGRLDVLVTSAGAGLDDDPHMRRFLDAEIPLGRWADLGEITGAALLLTDPQSGYITGSVLSVDGGWTAH
jgi:NAD(P)-dependent dehydrogenase (short-subunit alcohol dehydrogenase family)